MQQVGPIFIQDLRSIGRKALLPLQVRFRGTNIQTLKGSLGFTIRHCFTLVTLKAALHVINYSNTLLTLVEVCGTVTIDGLNWPGYSPDRPLGYTGSYRIRNRIKYACVSPLVICEYCYQKHIILIQMFQTASRRRNFHRQLSETPTRAFHKPCFNRQQQKKTKLLKKTTDISFIQRSTNDENKTNLFLINYLKFF